VLPISKVSNPVGFSYFRSFCLLPCLFKVCEVLMAGQMNRHIRNFGLLCPFHSGFRRHHSTTTSSLKGDGGHSEDTGDCFDNAGFYSGF
jgi:hypothetical protein